LQGKELYEARRMANKEKEEIEMFRPETGMDERLLDQAREIDREVRKSGGWRYGNTRWKGS
jgi:hypothetical protein